jgi:predicted amidohydrolase
MKVSIVLGQFPISFDIEQNLNYINHILDKSGKDDLIILPEGALSGYDDDVSFLKNIDLKKLSSAMGVIKKAVTKKEVHIIFGSCIYQDLNWFNAAIGYSHSSNDFVYRKVNLATHERGIFKAGDELPVYEINVMEQTLKFGIQMCREIRFPEQWKLLAMNGAQAFVYLTNAVVGKGLSVWRSHLISRAAENQRYVISSNNAHRNQNCPTMIIAPTGEVISEITSSNLDIIKQTIDTENVSDWYLSQSREDIVKLVTTMESAQ